MRAIAHFPSKNVQEIECAGKVVIHLRSGEVEEFGAGSILRLNGENDFTVMDPKLDAVPAKVIGGEAEPAKTVGAGKEKK